jgi:prepilin-type N-terminal cleavage/methylation domain-containing protein
MLKINKTKAKNRGFTLIELLVVIAILAVLAVVVVLTLNPAGLLQEARDSNRISDMATLKSALSLYLADVPTPALAPTTTICYVSIPTSSWSITVTSNVATATSTCNSWFTTTPVASTTLVTSTPNRTVTGTAGWIPVNVSAVSAGAPFAQWPIDPINNGSYFYAYTASTTGNVFKIAMFLESTKYRASGTADAESTDGGSNNFVFEGGSSLSL